ncbi:MAG: hypothetical protein ACFE85_09460 [Candidatus Hodarchaeota archaeon]
MQLQFDYDSLEVLSHEKDVSQIQNIFDNILSELISYLRLKPIYQKIVIELVSKEKIGKEAKVFSLDIGVEKFSQDDLLLIKILENYRKFLPFILLREAYYSFIPKNASETVKICINQIIENNFSSLSTFKEWKKLVRDSLVDREFIQSQFDKLQKFFNIEANVPFESSVQFFFKEIRENPLLCQNNNIKRFYDLIFERYAYRTSKSLFNLDIVKTLKVLIELFYKTKNYLNLTDYQNVFKQFKDKSKIETDISLRKFTENLQWINKCSSIAPSYDIYYNNVGLLLVIAVLKFNPLLEKNKIKTLLEEIPFCHAQKFSVNSFSTEIFLNFFIPNIYLNDLLNFLNNLELSGYITKKEVYKSFAKKSFLNLNYFTDISNIKQIIDPNNISYKRKYEIETKISYPSDNNALQLSLFDFIILDRIKWVSVTGLTFDKRIETLNAIKDDIENELRSHFTINEEFKNNLNKIAIFKTKFLQFLEENHNKGLLFLHFQLKNTLNYLSLTEELLNNNPDISNIYQLNKILKTKNIFRNIEENISIQNHDIKKVSYNFLDLYFQSKDSFNKQVEQYKSFYNVLNSCLNLKILDINEIKMIISELNEKGSNLAEDIYKNRKDKYAELFRSVSSYKITNKKIENTIERFLNHEPPIIKPFLINTIFTSSFAKYYPIIILKDTIEVKEDLNKLKSYFPRLYIYQIVNLVNKKNLIYILIYFLNIKEKRLFLSIIFNFFKDSLISIKRYFWRGVTRVSKQGKEFYDFEYEQFYYSKDFFKQLSFFSHKIFGKEFQWLKYTSDNNIQELFWEKNQKINELVNEVKKRVNSQDIDFKLEELNNLVQFRKELEKILQNPNRYKDLKAKSFFKRFIGSIKFIPTFQKFYFSQYYLFYRPFNYGDVDFKLMFKNTFQSVKYPACIETNPALVYRFIFPYRNPNKSYLNWLVKSKKNASEYCLFYKKKIYDILHFNRNLTKEGWNYSSIRFKSYMQNVLFNPNYDPKISEIREFDMNELSDSCTYGPDTKEFEALTQIYNTNSIDIKTYLGTRYLTIINAIETLLEKNLIFPYLSLKNLDFEEKVLIILPDINQQINQTIIKIFNFFNFSRIYEIEGEFFIYGFEDVRSFENGLLLEIWFPKCELDEFFEIFDLIFQYFKIKHYLILTDLVKGNQLIKSIFGNLKFLDTYNPLKNLIWNKHDKKWINHKLFNEKFEPIYPDLFYENKEESE